MTKNKKDERKNTVISPARRRREVIFAELLDFASIFAHIYWINNRYSEEKDYWAAMSCIVLFAFWYMHAFKVVMIWDEEGLFRCGDCFRFPPDYCQPCDFIVFCRCDIFFFYLMGPLMGILLDTEPLRSTIPLFGVLYWGWTSTTTKGSSFEKYFANHDLWFTTIVGCYTAQFVILFIYLLTNVFDATSCSSLVINLIGICLWFYQQIYRGGDALGAIIETIKFGCHSSYKMVFPPKEDQFGVVGQDEADSSGGEDNELGQV